MSAEALVGKKLGSYTLRRVIGVGSMGAVYLTRQSWSQHEYVLKVFLHASSLEPLQYIDFILRFRQEMSLVASLQHPHILPILEYEERDGFVYLVMPYTSTRSLESALNSQKLLSLPQIADYLDQLAGALDYAHEQDVLHLDIKPSNILITLDDKLLFTDFALAKTKTERQAARIRQFKVGMLDYMAPEQVMGKEPGEKADLYSLGAVLYHMVTGSAPFQGESLVEVAKKHLQEPPPSPRSKRADLPLAAEQVILRALSKHPGHRYTHAQDLATTFRLALETSFTKLEQSRNDLLLSNDKTSSEAYPSYSLFDPQWRTQFSPVKDNQPALGQSTPAPTAAEAAMPTDASVSVKDSPLPPKPEPVAEKSSHTLHAVHINPITPVLETQMNPEQNAYHGSILTVPEAEQSTAGTIMTLTSPAKVVNVPVAGQPGRYVVGLLRVPKKSEPEKVKQPAASSKTNYLNKNSKILGLALLVILLLGTGALWFAHQVSSTKKPAAVTVVKTPDLKATMAVQATATAEAHIILSDPLTTNIHNWPLIVNGPMLYAFKDNAYHIMDNDTSRGAPAVLSGLILQGPFVYTLTMEEIKGDDTSINNQFGMIFRATIQNKGGKTFTTFYSLEVLNKTGGDYQFWKYDNRQGSGGNFWEKLASHHFGNEFHVGHGPKSINTFKLIANGKNFTLIVNGKKAWTFQDGSFATGSIGMLVNLKGTEVAFSNLLLTHN
jgi:serine/threonine protein kinase